MNQAENDKSEKSSWTDLDRNYLIAAAIGLIVLITTIVIIHFARRETGWVAIFVYPLLIYFIFSQIISGFGFITGYFPIAQDIINWLKKTSKKKAYDQEELERLEEYSEILDKKERTEFKKLLEKSAEIERREKMCLQKYEHGKLSDRKARREMGKISKNKKEIEKEQINCKEKFKEEKEKFREKQKEFRGKFSEKIISREEKLEPIKFKLIMLIPIYVITIVGLVLTIIALINPIIRWANGITIPSLDTIDMVNEYYKGIVTGIGIVTIYIIPSIRALKDPNKFYIIRYREVDERRKILFFRIGKKKEDHRSIINRQFEDLRKYFWDIKTLIRRNLLIPMGLSMLIAAPIGSISIYLGIKTGIRRKELNRLDWIVFIIVAIALMCLLVPTYFTFFALFLKEGIHPSISILIKLIYAAFLIYAFILFTRKPIARIKQIE
ncbi:MAG: hypothetical protein FK730_01615 [Asgard group archaeon]|nr:hypothetical protein [Asgard group archaeon]